LQPVLTQLEALPKQQRFRLDDLHVPVQFLALHWIWPAHAPPVPQLTVASLPSTRMPPLQAIAPSPQVTVVVGALALSRAVLLQSGLRHAPVQLVDAVQVAPLMHAPPVEQVNVQSPAVVLQLGPLFAHEFLPVH
jgi:hypothetical protein